MLNEQAKEDLVYLYHNGIDDPLTEWAFWATLEAIGLEEEIKLILYTSKD